MNIKKPTISQKEMHEIGIKMIEESEFSQVIIDHVKREGNVSMRVKLMPLIVFTIADMMSQGVSFEKAFEVSEKQLEKMGI